MDALDRVLGLMRPYSAVTSTGLIASAPASAEQGGSQSGIELLAVTTNPSCDVIFSRSDPCNACRG
jgi:hypothetical protein